ncbi:MAG: UvrB/UvrC motif-containing protein, partial [Candidatus Yanofskybacteria bacterium]|nr:UvrB/UvrC motif-containing protein [Candidatus Yanofskybacteria bacterium]
EALIVESRLIKKYHPLFNIMLRDDKQYFYVGFTNEQFPKIFLSHQIQDTKYKLLNTKFLGPFTDGGALKTVLRLLRRIFPYCTCKQKHNNYCLNYHIGKCGGICCLKQPEPSFKTQILNFKNEYKKNIGAIKDILSGKKATLIKKLEKKMGLLAKKEMFEEAADLRDKLEKLKKVFENARIILDSKNKYASKDALENLAKIVGIKYIPKRIEGYDISNIQGEFATGAMAVFTDGQPDKSQYRKFKIRIANSPNDIAMLKETLVRRFNHPEWLYPDLIIVDGGKAQLNIARSVILNFKFSILKKMAIIALTKNDRHRGDHIYINNPVKLSADNYGKSAQTNVPLTKLPLEIRNLILQVDSEAHRFAISYYRKLHRKLN